MISKQQTTYALEFFGKAVILLSSQDHIRWEEVGLADMGDPDFREMMKDFHAVVSKHGLKKAKVALFLPLEDVALRTISGDNPAQTLAHDAGTPVEDICFTHATPTAGAPYNALYAYRETLTEAAGFIAQFGFTTSYFSARLALGAFTEQPKIYLDQKSKSIAPLALWSSVAVAALIALGAFSVMYSTSTTQTAPAPALRTQTPLAPTPTPAPTPAIIMMASAVQTFDEPIITAAFDAEDLDVTPIALTTQIRLSDFTVSTAAYVPQSADKVTDVINPSLPTLHILATEPLALSALSASAQPPVLPTITDSITTPTQTPQILTDAAVPEDANFPRPQRRPGTAPIETTTPIVPAVTVADVTPTTPRPPRRPAGLRNNAATTQAAIAQDLVQQAIQEDTAKAAAITTASARALGTNKRPPLKTSNFRNIVKRAAASPTTTVTTTTKTVSVSKPTTTKQPVDDKSTRAATTFSKGALSLVGVFGSPSKRSALFRTSSGGYRSVKIGQRVAGWKVVSISESSAKVTKGSRTKTMRLP
jgi:hypothetical protein